MFRMSKLTDYGTVVMTYLSREPDRVHSAGEIANAIGVTLPTVSKLLKSLQRGGLLTSNRGAKGGYQLSRSPDEISVADIIAALEGPIGLTECSSEPGLCAQESNCSVRYNWQRINQVVMDALRRVSLTEMVSPPVSVHRVAVPSPSDRRRAATA